MEGFLRNFALENAHGFYRNFLESVVLPNLGLFTPLVVFGELLVALLLLTGTVTRLAAALAMFFIALVVLLGAAGRSLGIDRFLHDRYPSIVLW